MDYRKADAKAAARAQFHGLWAAITTPFLPNLAVNEAGLRHNMRYLTDTLRVDGVFCTGVMGEFWSLTKEERKRIVEITVEEARGKCRVIAHTGHHSAHETVELTQHAESAGADYVILMTPYYPHANEEMIYDWFAFVSGRTNIGIWMFDTPFSGCKALSPALTARIARLENVCGAKIARSLEHYTEIRRLCGDLLVLSTPSENDLLAYIRDQGMQVHQSSASPYLLQSAAWQPIRDYSALAFQGRFGEAEAVSNTLKPLRAVQRRWLHERHYQSHVIPIAEIKGWSELLGMAAGPVRTPLLQLTANERARLRDDLDSVGLLPRGISSAVA